MEKYASKIPRNVQIQEVQQCVLLVTATKLIHQVNHDIVMVAISSGDGRGLITE